MLYKAGITGIGATLPDEILTNSDLEKMVETNDEWIVTRTGIRERRIAPKEVSSSDLSSKAAEEAIKMANIKPEDIGLIIVCTVTPDMIFPSTASIVQKNIGAVNASAFDLSAGCTGFIYGLTVASQFIQTGFYKHVLVIGTDLLSRITDFTDRNTCVLFGDGSGAFVVSRTEEVGILEEYIMSDGTGANFLTLKAGGSRMPASHETVDKKLHYLAMDGGEVFKFAVKILPEVVGQLLEKAKFKIENVDLFIPHQANIRIIESAAKRLKISMDKVALSIERYGNMSSASIPITVYDEYRKGRIKKGDNIVLVGFGAGLTYGAALLKWLI